MTKVPTPPVIVITGASSGIGKALAERYAQAGWRVVLAARNERQLKETAQALTQQYGNVNLSVVCDVSKNEDCKKLIAKTLAKFGTLNVLINNAGISMRAAFPKLDLVVLENLMQVNFWGMVYCTHAAMPALLAAHGTVVGISSIAGFRGLPERTGYSSSKFAMNGFLESLRTELLHSGVNVLTVCPGFTKSNIRNVALTSDGSPQKESPRDENKMMSAEAVAEAVFAAVEKRKRMIVLTTQGKLTQWLNRFFPSWMDGMVYRNFQKEGKSA